MRTGLPLSVGDLALTRFAISPMWEVVTSYRALAADPGPEPLRRWAAQVRPRLAPAGLDRGWLADLIPPQGHLPDFLNPVPDDRITDLAGELTAVRAAGPELVRHDLDCLRADAPGGLPARLRLLERDPGEALRRISAEIETYWQLALAPYWSRIRAVLEADVLQRARHAAEHGSAGMLGDLHGTVRWADGTLHLSQRHCAVTRIATGAGLLLIPSVFAWPRLLTRTVTPDPPQLCYPALAAATVWETRPHPRAEALAPVLGRTRTRLLTELDTPASTTELAARCALSPAAISQHLTALRTAGLVSSHRAGRAVLYARTAVADGWLAAMP
ncbi:helix-turn-helix domain-containing protein [Streptomyces sp. TLI_171]|uniref:ArsR/SmtB family transcription factor n=1 Tax=Streptomyces sp. TLI_171 TaxID=1938859 RepID=UPI00217E89A8|nr:helix-turn-helix domain-containing protein [Streptomyces sp. TLI_171]